jgi:hypothetical protein
MLFRLFKCWLGPPGTPRRESNLFVILSIKKPACLNVAPEQNSKANCPHLRTKTQNIHPIAVAIWTLWTPSTDVKHVEAAFIRWLFTTSSAHDSCRQCHATQRGAPQLQLGTSCLANSQYYIAEKGALISYSHGKHL